MSRDHSSRWLRRLGVALVIALTLWVVRSRRVRAGDREMIGHAG